MTGRPDTIVADRAEWLARRRTRIGGSDIAAVVGLSPWRSPWALWADKVGLLDDDDEQPSPSMQLGRDLEPLIALWFHRETGLHVHGEQTELTHVDDTWAGATVDGFVLESGTDELALALGVFEAKYDAGRPWETPPAHYVAQCQWQLHVSGPERAWLAVLHLPYGRPVFRVYELERDEADIAYLALHAEQFWTDHVLARVAPPVDGSDATTAAIKAAYGHADDQVGDVSELADMIDELRAFRDARKRLDADIARHENELRAALGAHSEGHVDGRLVVSWRSQGRTDIDTRAVRAEFGDRFDRRSTVRVLRLHAPKGAA